MCDFGMPCRSKLRGTYEVGWVVTNSRKIKGHFRTFEMKAIPSRDTASNARWLKLESQRTSRKRKRLDWGLDHYYRVPSLVADRRWRGTYLRHPLVGIHNPYPSSAPIPDTVRLVLGRCHRIDLCPTVARPGKTEVRDAVSRGRGTIALYQGCPCSGPPAIRRAPRWKGPISQVFVAWRVLGILGIHVRHGSPVCAIVGSQRSIKTLPR